MKFEINKSFDYENGFYLTSSVSRMSKFVTHLELFRKSLAVPGEILECGVFKGASLCRWIKFRALLASPDSKKIIAFDTFGEFPETEHEAEQAKLQQFIKEAGSKSIEREELVGLLKKLNLYENIELVEGNLLDTADNYIENNNHLKISLLHIDVDLYEPTKKALETFVPFVVKGGIVILDDYGAFPGANRAIDEYFKGSKVKIKKLPYSHSISFVER